jgi:cytochrome c oxidase subunit IV
MKLPANKLKILVWLILIVLTILSMIIAESGNPSGYMILLICAVFAAKGQLVIDHFMGMLSANRSARVLMLLYFYMLAPLIGLAFLFPEILKHITTL